MNQEFSVSMCVYGGDDPAFFDAALGSVISQTVPPSEIVLTVDGPIPPDTEGGLPGPASPFRWSAWRRTWATARRGGSASTIAAMT